ncbi:MAG: MBL fold metallo-hydrolase [Megasphaera sp.]|jgi:glyoxylase-like metal-dependent hydrolase (beta-lactamase superfamily II)|nr:MBL fold metallo-hydrolase [Megasphaera sp.]MCI1823918.1 MBL fold metallo-hydrolase [Megasphaera sp.]
MNTHVAFNPVRIIDPITNSNCYIIKEDAHVLIIDPNNFSLINAYLKAHQLHPEYVLLTHEHCDHISGLNELRQYYSFKVIAQAACSLGIQDKTLNMTRIMETYLYFKSNGTVLTPYPKFTCKPAELTFNETYYWHWLTHQFTFLHTPGHTPGSTCILVNNTVLFSGDYFIPGEEVITRLPGGNADIYERIGKNILRTLPENMQVYPGHGNTFLLTKEVKQHYGL